MEEIKKELMAEIQIDIRSLEDELKAAKSVNERMDREHFEKTAQINKLENEIAYILSTFNDQSVSLANDIKFEQEKNKELREKHQSLQENLKNAKVDESESGQKFLKVSEECENLRRQADILKETKDGLNSQLDKINAKLKGSLNVDQVNKLLCEPCGEKLGEAAKNRRVDAPSVLEDATASVMDERESIMKSVREYKDILSQQNSRPTESSGCLII
jgi:chromosome segregation ATPase